MVRNFRERLGMMRDRSPRIPTGIAPLDELVRGGFRQSHCVVLGGAPGAGKTTLLCQIARNLIRQGVAVGMLCADEEVQSVDIRNMQSIGIPRERAEAPTEVDIRDAEKEFSDLPF